MSDTTYVPPTLLELDSRAIASQDDRPAWLAARRAGITATEVRDLYLHKLTPLGLAAKKRAGDEGDLAGVPVIAWGRARERQVAAALAMGLNMQAESRVFRARDDARHLASPDAVGVDFDERLQIAEVKSGHPDFYGHDAMVSKGYLVQMVWQMHVTGAYRCRYVFEERLDAEGGHYVPGSTFAEWVVLDDHLPLLDELLELAGHALAVIADAVDDPEVREDVDVAAVNYLAALDAEKAATTVASEAAANKKAATAAKAAAYAAVRELAGSGEFRQESLLARVTKSPDVVTFEDVAVVDEEHPDVVAARAAVVDAQAALAVALDEHTTTRKERVVKPGHLTVTSPQKRKVGPVVSDGSRWDS